MHWAGPATRNEILAPAAHACSRLRGLETTVRR